MNGRRCDTEDRCGLCDSQQVTIWRLDWGLEGWDAPMSAKVADQIGSEAMAISGLTLLPIKNACDDGISKRSVDPTLRDAVMV